MYRNSLMGRWGKSLVINVSTNERDWTLKKQQDRTKKYWHVARILLILRHCYRNICIIFRSLIWRVIVMRTKLVDRCVAQNDFTDRNCVHPLWVIGKVGQSLHIPKMLVRLDETREPRSPGRTEECIDPIQRYCRTRGGSVRKGERDNCMHTWHERVGHPSTLTHFHSRISANWYPFYSYSRHSLPARSLGNPVPKLW